MEEKTLEEYEILDVDYDKSLFADAKSFSFSTILFVNKTKAPFHKGAFFVLKCNNQKECCGIVSHSLDNPSVTATPRHLPLHKGGFFEKPTPSQKSDKYNHTKATKK